MPHFSQRSLDRLSTCDKRLQLVFNKVIQHFDCTIIQGYRPREEQEQAFRDGKTKVHWPNSKHNKQPSLAVDVAPYPIDWNDRERFHLFAGFVLGTASSMGITLRWGGDWDQDTEVKDNSFDDLVHFQLEDS